MNKATLRRVGGSVMVAIPPAMMEELGLEAQSVVGLSVEGGRLVIEPRRTRYSLAVLLAQCDPDSAPADEDRTWTAADDREGGELI